jgi:hypothetical protein
MAIIKEILFGLVVYHALYSETEEEILLLLVSGVRD